MIKHDDASVDHGVYPHKVGLCVWCVAECVFLGECVFREGQTLGNVLCFVHIVCSLLRPWGITQYVELASHGRVRGGCEGKLWNTPDGGEGRAEARIRLLCFVLTSKGGGQG